MFTGIEKVRESLDRVYGAGKVSLANASVRWIVHHSQLDPKYGGGYYWMVNITTLYT